MSKDSTWVTATPDQIYDIAIVQIKQRDKRIAYLEKQVNQLREALQLIQIKDENKMYQSCPDCDYPGTCKSDMVCKSMPRSSIGNIAHKALEGTE